MVYLGFSRPKKFNPVSFLISWWIKRPYSHVYLRFESSNPKIPSTVYHAARGMVHFLTFDRFLEKNIVIAEYKLEVDKEKRTEILLEAMNLSGEKYGYVELIKIIISDIVYSLFNKICCMEDSQGYICSELAGKMLADKMDFKFNKPLNLLKPSDIEDKLFEMGYKNGNPNQ